MSKEELLQYNHSQLCEMDKHKWIESEKQGRDLGEEAYLDWIKCHSLQFRKEWYEKKAV